MLHVVLNWKSIDGLAGTIAASVVIGFGALWLAGAHRHVWGRIALQDVVGLLFAAIVVALSTAAIVALQVGADAFSRVLLGGIVMYVCGWAAPRLMMRLWLEWYSGRTVGPPSAVEPVLVYGSRRRTEQFIKIAADGTKYRVVGFLHDDPGLSGKRLHGVDSMGSLAHLGHALARLSAKQHEVKRLIIAGDGERPDELQAALDAAAKHGLLLCRLPSLLSLVEPSRLGEVVKAVSIEDILHRDQISINDSRVPTTIAGKTVLVTGAGGSIGSELVRQIATHKPAGIILVESCEFNLYQIDLQMSQRFPHVERITALCDIRDRAAMATIFDRYRPSIVLHAAALKHVPLMETHLDQAILTNILGTHNVATLASDYGVEIMTLVSTDKAVNPTSIMGCTKRWAEIICQSLDEARDHRASPTRYACVRFGNVLDSAGSVVPLFRQQINAGGPLTVTHRDITRFFMTIPEACELILVATAATAQTRPNSSQVFVLDMGDPIRIADLAERMIQLHGFRPYEEIDIEYVGLRPGEKLYEELAHRDEDLMPAPFPKANLARARGCSLETLDAALARILHCARHGNEADMEEALRELVPEFSGRPRRAPARPVVEALAAAS
ncbi:polysaccharide biosynthesis protein [Polymorphobacter sp.]|uniref:polysaccharide biosynthesis protein n=1 Tax=Polymorphobacter sp. TaxID=1909290 RepID=UPI003F6F5F46